MLSNSHNKRFRMLSLAVALACFSAPALAEDTSFTKQAVDANRNLYMLKTEAERMKARAELAEAYAKMSKSGVMVDANGQISEVGGPSYVATFGVPENTPPGMPRGPSGMDALSAAAPVAVDSTPKLQSITGDRAFFAIPGHGVVQAQVGETIPGGYKVVALDNGATLERGGSKTVVSIDWGLPDEQKPKADPLSTLPGRR